MRFVTSRKVIAGALIGAVLFFARIGGAGAAGEAIQAVVVLDNDSIEVVLLTFPPGSASEQHANAEPELGIILEGELTLITPSGREVLTPGMVRWLAPYTPHEARDEGAVPVRMWALTLKKSK